MNPEVVIVGAGPVGCSLALGLAHHGVSSLILDRSREVPQESRALVIWPRTAELLRDWNAWEPLLAAGRFSTRFTPYDAVRGEPLLTVDFSDIEDSVQTPGVLFIPQYESVRILRDCVEREPLCDLRLDEEAVGLEQDENEVRLQVRTAAGLQEIRAPFAVGADGAHGFVRNALGFTLEGTTYATRVAIADVGIDGAAGSVPSPRIALDVPGLLFAIEYAPGLWRTIASVAPSVGDDAALSAEAHAKRTMQLFGERAAIAQIHWSSLFRIHRRHAPNFVSGRVALAGDAAHLNSPAGGQGMNAGIHDTANLAWRLGCALRSTQCAKQLLIGYDIERREMQNDSIERTTDFATRIAVYAPAFFKRLAFAWMRRSLRARGMRRKACRALGMLDGRYTRSPDVDTSHPLAGRRIGDVRLDDGRRINAARGGRAALLCCGGASLDGLDTLVLTVPPKRWLLKYPSAIVIRPDGFVAAVIEKPTLERVERKWKRAFCSAMPLPASERV
ncbi:MAG TPA: FAD-dependent monooxygenase [Candidatus Dormibacteraeota bacterium]|nr:FAD-dependent monooxygenase [Candidatus Dormibacteraeota bacterium]